MFSIISQRTAVPATRLVSASPGLMVGRAKSLKVLVTVVNQRPSTINVMNVRGPLDTTFGVLTERKLL